MNEYNSVVMNEKLLEPFKKTLENMYRQRTIMAVKVTEVKCNSCHIPLTVNEVNRAWWRLSKDILCDDCYKRLLDTRQK